MIVKKLGTFGIFFMALAYWIIVFFFGFIVYFPFFQSVKEIIIWLSIFLILFLIVVALPVILVFYSRKNCSQK
jgi:hypothetical protein